MAQAYTITIPSLSDTYQAHLPHDVVSLISRPGIQRGDEFNIEDLEKATHDEVILRLAKGS